MLSDFAETVTVRTYTQSFDEHMESVPVRVDEEVGGVLVAPAEASDLGAERPDGDLSAVTLAFPKSWGGPLRGALVRVRGEWYSVQGDPVRVAGPCPTDWNLSARAVRFLG